jgi:hypothetical protein
MNAEAISAGITVRPANPGYWAWVQRLTSQAGGVR